MAKTITGKTKLMRSTSSPTAAGGKVVQMAAPKSTKTADNMTKRTGGPQKPTKK